MKRFVLSALLVLGIVTLAFAQGGDNRAWGRAPGMPTWGHHRGPQFATETVTVSGDLTLVRGALAVKSGDISYLVIGLSRYIGFIDALKEGASVSLEGTAISNPRDTNIKYLFASKLTIAGKDYEVGVPWQAWGNMPNRREAPNRGEAPPQPRAPMGRRR